MTPQELATNFTTSGLAEADIDTLNDFYKACQAPIIFGRYLFPTRPDGYAIATRELGVYCAYQALAQAQRLKGLIQDALDNEAKADAIFDKLPEFARW